MNFSKLRSICSKKSLRKNVFFVKLVRLKFDLKLCSIKEFIDLLNKIDNSAIRYIKLTTKSKITFRNMDHLTIRNFMGELEVTLESKYEKNLKNSEFYLKRLADAVHYRLAQKIPSSDLIIGNDFLVSQRVLLQSPPDLSLNESESSSSTFESGYNPKELNKDEHLRKDSSLSESFSSPNLKSKLRNQNFFKNEKMAIRKNEFQKKIDDSESIDFRTEMGNITSHSVRINKKH